MSCALPIALGRVARWCVVLPLLEESFGRWVYGEDRRVRGGKVVFL